MVEDFAHTFQAHEGDLRAEYGAKAPGSYEAIFTDVCKLLHRECKSYDKPDPTRITVLNHGDYQGTLLFVVAAEGYQPNTYWACKVSYGSCTGCDTFQAIQGYGGWDEPPTEQQVTDYVALARHMVQAMAEVSP